MPIWIAVTLVSAALQTLRFMLQKRLKGAGLSTGGATFSRFLFGAPLALAGTALALGLGLGGGPQAGGTGLATGLATAPGPAFWGFVLAGGAAQVCATYMTVALFSLRNFAVGVAFTKTETVQVALFSAVLLGEGVSAAGMGAIAVGLAGVLLLSRAPAGATGGGLLSRATLYGVAAGGLFGLSAICYRGATLELMPGPAALRAVATLAAVTTAQSLGMAAWLAWREPGELARVVRAWRRTVWVGVTGMLGSLGWFTAFALQNAAYVRTLGQVEIVFTLMVSALVFRERLTPRELAGTGLVVASVVLLVAVIA
ncbi:EamA family transporter [Frigidibacter sp. MR17.24]|uniref:EamA family transporter n=1 Tax=Frigidibacter sp. MR17.24 TaxID=3127345 RepID=UPI003012C831